MQGGFWHTGAAGLSGRGPEAAGYRGEGWGCECFVLCSVFAAGKQQSSAVGALAIRTDLVAQEVANPAESSFYLSRCHPCEPPGVVLSPPVLLTANLSHDRGWMEPTTGCGVCKIHGSPPASLGNNLACTIPAQLPTHCSIFFSSISPHTPHFDCFFC